VVDEDEHHTPAQIHNYNGNLKNSFTGTLSDVTEGGTISRRKNRRVRRATQVEDRRCGASRASVRTEQPRTPR